MLRDGCALNVTRNQLTSELRRNILRSSTTCSEVESLIDRGADCNGYTYDEDGYMREWYEGSSLHLCVLSGRLDLLMMLVSAGARIEQTNGTGNTPFLLAVKHNRYEIANFLADQGARMLTEGMHVEIVNPHICPKLAVLLVENGYKPDSVDALDWRKPTWLNDAC